jgi:hypothetical protein
LDEYILFSKNGEDSFEVKIPFSSDSLSQVSDLLTKQGFLVERREMSEVQSELAELKTMLSEVRKENESLNELLKDILKGLDRSETKPAAPQQGVEDETHEEVQRVKVPDNKISMLPSPDTKSFKLISRLAKEYMDGEFTTKGLTLYEKRVFSLLVKRYEFVKRIGKEGRSVVYSFHSPALESLCKELGGRAMISIRSRVRSKSVERFLERMKERYPHFAFKEIPSQAGYKQYELLFSDKSVRKSIMGNLTRSFGPNSVKVT